MCKLPLALLLALGFLLAARLVVAGDSTPDPQTMQTFVKTLLREQPRFRANGIFTLKKAGKPAVVCGARVRFDKDVGAVFSYNTTGEDLEPWDFYYWKRTLALFVYDRERKTVVKSELLGTPLRPVFNFVWDVLEETGDEPGFKSLLFSGLMRMTLEETADSLEVTFRKQLIPLPIKELVFTFDTQHRLQAIHLTEADGSAHSFKVLQYQTTTEKLRKPKLQKKPYSVATEGHR